jgi:hypothetical protein
MIYNSTGKVRRIRRTVDERVLAVDREVFAETHVRKVVLLVLTFMYPGIHKRSLFQERKANFERSCVALSTRATRSLLQPFRPHPCWSPGQGSD